MQKLFIQVPATAKSILGIFPVSMAHAVSYIMSISSFKLMELSHESWAVENVVLPFCELFG
jgi:hypothetical protein